jgi:hypothetical protein
MNLSEDLFSLRLLGFLWLKENKVTFAFQDSNYSKSICL